MAPSVRSTQSHVTPTDGSTAVGNGRSEGARIISRGQSGRINAETIPARSALRRTRRRSPSTLPGSPDQGGRDRHDGQLRFDHGPGQCRRPRRSARPGQSSSAATSPASTSGVRARQPDATQARHQAQGQPDRRRGGRRARRRRSAAQARTPKRQERPEGDPDGARHGVAQGGQRHAGQSEPQGIKIGKDANGLVGIFRVGRGAALGVAEGVLRGPGRRTRRGSPRRGWLAPRHGTGCSHARRWPPGQPPPQAPQPRPPQAPRAAPVRGRGRGGIFIVGRCSLLVQTGPGLTNQPCDKPIVHENRVGRRCCLESCNPSSSSVRGFSAPPRRSRRPASRRRIHWGEPVEIERFQDVEIDPLRVDADESWDRIEVLLQDLIDARPLAS